MYLSRRCCSWRSRLSNHPPFPRHDPTRPLPGIQVDTVVRLQVVEKLVEQGEAVAQTMLQQLLSRLRANVQLPECLRIVGHLRRLSVFSEQVCTMRSGSTTKVLAKHEYKYYNRIS